MVSHVVHSSWATRCWHSLYGGVSRCGRICAKILLVAITIFAGAFLPSVAIGGFIASWILPSHINNLLSTVAGLFERSGWHKLCMSLLSILCMPATLILAASTFGVALHRFWIASDKELEQWWQRLLS